jgi:YHS domain-containing protein
MKYSKSYLLALTATLGVLGATALATHLTAADGTTPSCCGGTVEPLAADVKATPDLLTTCPVSGDKLGEMGKPLIFTYQDQEVKLCCKGCKKDFDKDPAQYLAKIRAADKK